MNFGEWLRWEAALEEMRTYYAVPHAARQAALKQIEQGVRARLASVPAIREVRTSFAVSTDPGGIQSIFPFYLTSAGRPLTMDEAVGVYRTLNDDIIKSSRLHDTKQEVTKACRLGQPVALTLDDGRTKTGAFRVSSSARMIAEAWGKGDRKLFEERISGELQELGRAVERAAKLAERAS